MRTFLTRIVSSIPFLLCSTAVLAHSGHATDELFHPLLHDEHLLVLGAVAAVVMIAVKLTRK